MAFRMCLHHPTQLLDLLKAGIRRKLSYDVLYASGCDSARNGAVRMQIDDAWLGGIEVCCGLPDAEEREDPAAVVAVPMGEDEAGDALDWDLE